MASTHAHTDRPDGPPAESATPDWHADPRPTPFMLRSPRRPGDPADPAGSTTVAEALGAAREEGRRPRVNRVPVHACGCDWSTDPHRATGFGEVLRLRKDAQEVHDLFLDLEDGGADVFAAVLDHFLFDIECGFEKDQAYVHYLDIERFVAQHNWRNPTRMYGLASNLRLVVGDHARQLPI